MENIIIGTLLESNDDENYFEECRSSITPDMFSDERNRRIFCLIAEMNGNGITNTDPSNILATYGDGVIDLIADMADRVNNYSFLYKKCVYNEMRYLHSLAFGDISNYTQVTFTDYVNNFIWLVYDEQTKNE